MFAKFKKIVGLILLAALLCVSGTALAYSGSSYTSDSSLATKLDNLINGKVAIFSNVSTKFPVGSSLNNSQTYYWRNGYYSGKQCYAYAQAAYYYLFGDVPYQGYSSSRAPNSVNISDVKALKTLSYELFIEKGVGCGAYIRTTTKSDGSYYGDGGHSMIVLTYTKDNITILHGNANGSGSVAINTYTWANFNSTHLTGRSRVITHIIQPKQTAFSLSYTTLDTTPRIGVSIKESTAEDSCHLQSAPYDDSKYYIGNIEKGGIIYFKGAVKNKYGNTWYVTDDGLYVFKSDVDITEEDASFSSTTAANYVGVVKTNHGYLKEKPFEAANHTKTVAKGKTVTIVSAVTNSHGNVWYVTDGGYYIYSGDVTTYVSEVLFPIQATFKNTEKRSSHVVPYQDSDAKSTIKKNAIVTVTGFVTNEYGNVWAQLKDGSYVHFCDKGDSARLEFVSATTDITKSDVQHRVHTTSTSKTNSDPYTIVVNASTGIYLQGTYKSVAPILTITARVRNSSSQILSSPKVVVSPNATLRTFTTHNAVAQRSGNSVNITESMTFKGMSKSNSNGAYVYELAVQYGFEYGGKTYSFGSEQLVDSYGFYVGKNTSATVAPTATPTPTPTPEPTETPTPTPTATPVPTPVQSSDAVIEEMAFYNCAGLVSYDIPVGVTSIGNYAFYGCTSLTSVSIPNTVNNISAGAFSMCSSLKSIIIPSSVTSIGEYAFNDCASLTYVVIPSSVTSMGKGIFNLCSNVTAYVSYGSYAHEYCIDNGINFVLN